MSTEDPRDAWLEGYAEGLIEGIQQQPELTVERWCTCGVLSGGIRDPRPSCKVHGGPRE